MLTSPSVLRLMLAQDILKKAALFMGGIHAHEFHKLKDANLHSGMSIRISLTPSGGYTAVAESTLRGHLSTLSFDFTESDILEMARMQDDIINEENRKALLKKSASAPILHARSATPLKERKRELSIDECKANVRHLLTDVSITQGPFRSLFATVPFLNQNSEIEITQAPGFFKVKITDSHGNHAHTADINLSTQQFINLARSYAMGIHKGWILENNQHHLIFSNANDADFAGRALMVEFGMQSFHRTNRRILEIGEELRNFIQETNRPVVMRLPIPNPR